MNLPEDIVYLIAVLIFPDNNAQAFLLCLQLSAKWELISELKLDHLPPPVSHFESVHIVLPSRHLTLLPAPLPQAPYSIQRHCFPDYSKCRYCNLLSELVV